MELFNIDERELDAELKVCGDEEDALTRLIKRHLAEAAYIFASLMNGRIHKAVRDGTQESEEDIRGQFEDYQKWIYESLCTPGFERFARTAISALTHH
ncbi:hypothetical protein [Sphingobium sp. YBL2]|uniref:hypothetical protein n=1 Tax=Sphingobium sp. (strain YBL2) TaxID=484429 RepID=UPI0006981C80|nr:MULTISPECIES: hypothetical protein [Sphingomonadaceae]